MDKLSFLLDAKYFPLTLGLGIILLIGIELLTGEILQSRGPIIVERAENPKAFRVRIVIQIVVAVVLIGVFLYQSFGK